jgi:hypothetical protein
VRKALGTLPWVEQATIETDVNKRQVRFNLTQKDAFDEGAVKEALRAQGFAQADVRARP